MGAEDTDLQDILGRLDPEAQLLVSEGVLGQDAEDFINSDLGRAMVGLAQQEYAEALLGMEKTPLWRGRKHQELQNKAWRAKSFLTWLASLVIRGRQAVRQLDQQGVSDE